MPANTTVAEVLNEAANRIEQNGHWQGGHWQGASKAGALNSTCAALAISAIAKPDYSIEDAAIFALAAKIDPSVSPTDKNDAYYKTVVDWNDNTPTDVVLATMRETATSLVT